MTGLLLSDAVNAAAHGKKRSGVHHSYIPAGIGVTEFFLSRLVALIVKAGAYDRAITDVMVDVAVIHPVAVIL